MTSALAEGRDVGPDRREGEITVLFRCLSEAEPGVVSRLPEARGALAPRMRANCHLRRPGPSPALVRLRRAARLALGKAQGRPA